MLEKWSDVNTSAKWNDIIKAIDSPALQDVKSVQVLHYPLSTPPEDNDEIGKELMHE